jgi:hypothetical protein
MSRFINRRYPLAVAVLFGFLGSLGVGKLVITATLLAHSMRLDTNVRSAALVFYGAELFWAVAAIVVAYLLVTRHRWIPSVLIPLSFGILGWETCRFLYRSFLIDRPPSAFEFAYLFALGLVAACSASSKVKAFVTLPQP